MIGHQPATQPTSEPASRRRLLRLIGAGSAALVASLLPRNGIRAGHDPNAADPDALHLGRDNSTDAPTQLFAEIPTEFPADPDPRALAVSIAQGRAVSGDSSFGVGVTGHSGGGSPPEIPWVGVEGTATGTGIGVVGESKSGEGTGVAGSSGSGPGVQGNSESGPGVVGSSGSGPGVQGNSESGPGVVGNGSGEHAGVEGHGQNGPGGAFDSENAAGLTATSQNRSAVAGFSETGRGGSFSSQNGVGVRGFIQGGPGSGPGVFGAAPGDAPAIRAVSAPFEGGAFPPDGGLALEVVGNSHFSTAGSSVIPAGDNSVAVAAPAVTADSHITVTLTGDPGSRQLLWVERTPGTGFTVHLTSAPPPQRPAVTFTYLIVEPVL